MTAASPTFDVGGVLLHQPFKIRRLGHIGFNVDDLDVAIDFYSRVLGFRIPEIFDLADFPEFAEMASHLDDTRVVFATHNSDHHALILAHRSLGSIVGDDALNREVTTSQITWQVGSLAEVMAVPAYLAERDVPIVRVGRDMPGSNWHTYFRDPDGHTVEMYYGMEQLGWDGRPKPRSMYHRRFDELPPLPQMSEAAELAEAIDLGIDLAAGDNYRTPSPPGDEPYDVEGVLLARPFKITGLGPVSIYVKDLERAESYYRNVLGFVMTEYAEVDGKRCAFMRVGAEHHSLALIPVELRERLTPGWTGTCMALGLRVATYAQLRGASEFLTGMGYKQLDTIPPDVYPGIDYAAHFVEPFGQCLQLHYTMEQVGWGGKPRPQSLRRTVEDPWPAALEPLSDTYADQTFQGPLG
jgi:catechol 2,3-dioxygenase-like lactoylglutathione lyase family enzyme